MSQLDFLRLKLFQAEGLFCLGGALLLTTLGFEGGQTAMFVGHRPGQLVLACHVGGDGDVVVGVGGVQGLLGLLFASGPFLVQGKEIVLKAQTGRFKLGDGGARLVCLVDAASIEGLSRLLQGVERLLHGCTLLSERAQAALFVGNATIAFGMDGVEGRLGSDALFGDCTQPGGFISQQDLLGASQCADGGFGVGTVISEPGQPGFFVGEALLVLGSQRFKGDLGSGSLVGEALQATLLVGEALVAVIDDGLQGGLGAGADDGEGLQAGSAVLLVGVAGAVELGDGLLLLRSFIGERGNALLLFGDADRPLPGQACQFDLGSDPSLPGRLQRHFLLSGGGIGCFDDGSQPGGFAPKVLEAFGSVVVVSMTADRLLRCAGSPASAHRGRRAKGHR